MALRPDVIGPVVIALAAAVSPADVKETVRLVLTGGDLRQPITVDDPALMAESNVYRGAFLDGPAGIPDPRLARYRVAFDLQTLHGVKHEAYVVWYVTSPDTGEAFVYLPGDGDIEYRSNIASIIRDGRDGTWHRASPAFARGIDAIVARP